MITIGNVIDVCKIISEASSKLTMLIGEPVELALITPKLPGIEYNQQVIRRMDREIMIFTILEAVCEQYMISSANMRGPGRAQTYCDARKSASKLLHSHVVDMTDEEIGFLLHMERTTALYNRTQAAEMIQDNEKFRRNYYKILTKLKNELLENGQAKIE